MLQYPQTSLEEIIANRTNFIESDLTDKVINNYVRGYRDAVNGFMDMRSYRRVNLITSVEEFVYMYGYKIAQCDIGLEIHVNPNQMFNAEYVSDVKSALSALDIPSTHHSLSVWLELLVEN